MKIKPTYENTEKIQNFVEQNLPKNCKSKISHQIAIITDEIYSNIVKYSEATEFELQIKKQNDKIYLTFIDNGKKYNPLLEKEIDNTLPKEKRPIGKLGIQIVKKFSDHIEYQHKDNKNILIIGKNLK